jgi:hypothetical protein
VNSCKKVIEKLYEMLDSITTILAYVSTYNLVRKPMVLELRVPDVLT